MYDRTRAARRLLLASLLTCVLGAGLALAAGPQPGGLDGVVNVNTATQEELELLPGIGEAKARAILEARHRNGGFESVDALLEVKGIGQVALERIRPYVVIQGKTTARPN